MKHPYSDFEGTPLWRTLDAELLALETNGDMQLRTAREYVIGSMCRRLVVDGLALGSDGKQPAATRDAAGVAIIVDPEYGERVAALAGRFHVWLSDSPSNRAAADAFRSKHPEFHQYSGITTFRVDRSKSANGWATEILDTVVEHHGPYSQIVPLAFIHFIGCEPAPDLVTALAKMRYTEITETEDGWRASLPTAV